MHENGKKARGALDLKLTGMCGPKSEVKIWTLTGFGNGPKKIPLHGFSHPLSYPYTAINYLKYG